MGSVDWNWDEKGDLLRDKLEAIAQFMYRDMEGMIYCKEWFEEEISRLEEKQ